MAEIKIGQAKVSINGIDIGEAAEVSFETATEEVKENLSHSLNRAKLKTDKISGTFIELKVDFTPIAMALEQCGNTIKEFTDHYDHIMTKALEVNQWIRQRYFPQSSLYSTYVQQLCMAMVSQTEPVTSEE
jgi:hypothetical protein